MTAESGITTDGEEKAHPLGEAGVEVWSSRSWRERAVRWLDDRLADAGVERTGETEQVHLRPWATVLKAPTTEGPVWFKAAGPGTAAEIGLYEILREVVPDRVLPPIAIDVDRAWIVLPDGGPTIGERFDGPGLLEALVTVMPQYGRLQRDLAPQVGRMLDLGVADMRAERMPARFDEALDAVRRYVERRGTAADRAIVERVEPMRDTYAEWCGRLAQMPGEPSLDHNDLHAWNVFCQGDDGALQGRFYDWGDGVVAHPFASMLMGLGFLNYYLKIGEDDPRLLRIRDAYLEVFTDLAPRAELVETLELACRVGKVARALTWNRAVRALDESDLGEGDEEYDEFAEAPLRCMESLLDASSYLGGA
jgi:hypothetical protein